MQKIASLHRQYGGVIYDLCKRILVDRSLAEDAVQETFIRAFQSLSTFTYGESYLPWLYRISTNVCRRMLSKNRAKWAASIEYPDRLSAPERDPINQIHVKKTIEYLMDELDERGQNIVIAYYIWGMDQSQIARSLGISRRAVVKRLSMLRKRASHIFNGGTQQ
ncbi:MAG: sigma-70 family RNA polymerase sigma factor [Myxococcota bacterium]|nr:sigma-70 family RNA polymerase sigma factor [Myxococcota bacterium]